MSCNRIITLPAEPGPITIDVSKTALIVVDMQNAFARKGAYFDLAGQDISLIEQIIPPCRRIIRTGRKSGVKVVYLQMIREKSSFDRHQEESPSIVKSRIPGLMEQYPGIEDKIYFEGTWGSEIIDELMPEEMDIIIKKKKYNGFIGTDLDDRLKSLDIRYLLFIGTATNICVESTIRHAFFLDYFPILIADGVSQMGPKVTQEATILNVLSTFGWVTYSGRLIEAFGGDKR